MDAEKGGAGCLIRTVHRILKFIGKYAGRIRLACCAADRISEICF